MARTVVKLRRDAAPIKPIKKAPPPLPPPVTESESESEDIDEEEEADEDEDEDEEADEEADEDEDEEEEEEEDEEEEEETDEDGANEEMQSNAEHDQSAMDALSGMSPSQQLEVVKQHTPKILVSVTLVVV